MVVTLAFLICRLAVALSQPAAAAEVVAPPAAAVLHDKRVPPSYDGRPPAPPTAREGLIWVPRAVLLPAHLVAEYVLRRPIVGLGWWGDEHYLWNRIHDFFTWDEGRAGVYPIANIDLGLRPPVGANLSPRQGRD